jgi:hypothetical protein
MVLGVILRSHGRDSTTCFQEEAGECAEDQDMSVSARDDQSVKLLEWVPKEGEWGDGQVPQHVKEAVLLRPGDGDEVAVLVDRSEAAVVQQVENHWDRIWQASQLILQNGEQWVNSGSG